MQEKDTVKHEVVHNNQVPGKRNDSILFEGQLLHYKHPVFRGLFLTGLTLPILETITDLARQPVGIEDIAAYFVSQEMIGNANPDSLRKLWQCFRKYGMEYERFDKLVQYGFVRAADKAVKVGMFPEMLNKVREKANEWEVVDNEIFEWIDNLSTVTNVSDDEDGMNFLSVPVTKAG